MLLHIPDYVGGMQLITCPTVESKTDEHKTNSKVTFCDFRQRWDQLCISADN